MHGHRHVLRAVGHMADRKTTQPGRHGHRPHSHGLPHLPFHRRQSDSLLAVPLLSIGQGLSTLSPLHPPLHREPSGPPTCGPAPSRLSSQPPKAGRATYPGPFLHTRRPFPMPVELAPLHLPWTPCHMLLAATRQRLPFAPRAPGGYEVCRRLQAQSASRAVDMGAP